MKYCIIAAVLLCVPMSSSADRNANRTTASSPRTAKGYNFFGTNGRKKYFRRGDKIVAWGAKSVMKSVKARSRSRLRKAVVGLGAIGLGLGVQGAQWAGNTFAANPVRNIWNSKPISKLRLLSTALSLSPKSEKQRVEEIHNAGGEVPYHFRQKYNLPKNKKSTKKSGKGKYKLDVETLAMDLIDRNRPMKGYAKLGKLLSTKWKKKNRGEEKWVKPDKDLRAAVKEAGTPIGSAIRIGETYAILIGGKGNDLQFLINKDGGHAFVTIPNGIEGLREDAKNKPSQPSENEQSSANTQSSAKHVKGMNKNVKSFFNEKASLNNNWMRKDVSNFIHFHQTPKGKQRKDLSAKMTKKLAKDVGLLKNVNGSWQEASKEAVKKLEALDLAIGSRQVFDGASGVVVGGDGAKTVQLLLGKKNGDFEFRTYDLQ